MQQKKSVKPTFNHNVLKQISAQLFRHHGLGVLYLPHIPPDTYMYLLHSKAYAPTYGILLPEEVCGGGCCVPRAVQVPK